MVRDQIPLLVRTGLVRPALRRSLEPRSPDPAPRPTGADEPEPDPPQTVAAHPAVVDAESDTPYGDPVHWQYRDEFKPDCYTTGLAASQTSPPTPMPEVTSRLLSAKKNTRLVLRRDAEGLTTGTLVRSHGETWCVQGRIARSGDVVLESSLPSLR